VENRFARQTVRFQILLPAIPRKYRDFQKGGGCGIGEFVLLLRREQKQSTIFPPIFLECSGAKVWLSLLHLARVLGGKNIFKKTS
jgi:hypothetical protein